MEYRGRDSTSNVDYYSVVRSCSNGVCVPHADNCSEKLITNPGCMVRHCCQNADLCNASSPGTAGSLLSLCLAVCAAQLLIHRWRNRGIQHVQECMSYTAQTLHASSRNCPSAPVSLCTSNMYTQWACKTPMCYHTDIQTDYKNTYMKEVGNPRQRHMTSTPILVLTGLWPFRDEVYTSLQWQF